MPMKAQTIFNKVVKHLLTQKKRAVDENGNCSYRTETGLKCAVGCLITNKEYSLDMEGESVETLFPKHPAIGARLGNKDLLMKLQEIHDDDIVPPSRWPQKLRALAKREGLEYPCPS